MSQRLHSLGAKAGKHIYTNPHACTNTDVQKHMNTANNIKNMCLRPKSRMDRRRERGVDARREKENMQKSLDAKSGRERGRDE